VVPRQRESVHPEGGQNHRNEGGGGTLISHNGSGRSRPTLWRRNYEKRNGGGPGRDKKKKKKKKKKERLRHLTRLF